MQPYQEASQEINRQQAAPGKLVKGLTSTALQVGSGAAILNKIMPFFNSHIPQDLAIKGLSKVNPTLGKFVEASIDNGYTLDDVKNFISQKSDTETPKKPAKEDRNIIQQYSDQLYDFLKNEIAGGRMVLEAGARAKKNPEFQNVINKIEKDHKTSFSDILRSIFGQGEYSLPSQNPPSQVQSQSNQNASSANDKLMQMLDKFSSTLRG